MRSVAGERHFAEQAVVDAVTAAVVEYRVAVVAVVAECTRHRPLTVDKAVTRQ